MASNEEDLCTSYADFAVICSFTEQFGEKLGLTLPNIGELQTFFEDTDNVNPLLAQSICLLLRRINRSVKFDRWERGLQRFAHTYSHQDGWELERFGFKKAKLEVKIRVFKNLLEAQFDLYKSFKEKVNLVGATELRLQPCGRDKKGVSYWCQLDDCANLRIYRDDQDEETWTLVASSREELVALIAELESESPPAASREMSVDGSRSGTVTPIGLSEAPTPVDSKAATPVASGRTSPVIDTGQIKIESDNTSEGVFEKVKEKLIVDKPPIKAEENDLQQDGEILVKVKDDATESKQLTKVSEGKEEKPIVAEEKPESVESKENIPDTIEPKSAPKESMVEEKRQEVCSPPKINKKSEEKPLPLNKDTVIRERDKKWSNNESDEQSAIGKKESVWDKLSRQKEEKAESKASGKAVQDVGGPLTESEKLLEERSVIKLMRKNTELSDSKSPLEKLADTVGRLKEGAAPSNKESLEKVLNSKVSDDKQNESSKWQTSSDNKAAVDKAPKSPFPTSIGSVSITPLQPGSVPLTPVQTAKDRLTATATSCLDSVVKNLPASTTLLPAAKQVLPSMTGPRLPSSLTVSPTKGGPLSPTFRGGPLSPTFKEGPLSPTSHSKSGALSLTSITVSNSSTISPSPVLPVRSGPLSPSRLASDKISPHPPSMLPSSKSGPISPTSIPFGKSGPLSQTSLSSGKSGPLSPSVQSGKSGPLSPTSVSHGKSGPLSPTSVSHGKSGPLSPTTVPSGKSGPLSPSSIPPSKSGPLSSSALSGKSGHISPASPPASKDAVHTLVPITGSKTGSVTTSSEQFSRNELVSPSVKVRSDSASSVPDNSQIPSVKSEMKSTGGPLSSNSSSSSISEATSPASVPSSKSGTERLSAVPATKSSSSVPSSSIAANGVNFQSNVAPKDTSKLPSNEFHEKLAGSQSVKNVEGDLLHAATSDNNKPSHENALSNRAEVPPLPSVQHINISSSPKAASQDVRTTDDIPPFPPFPGTDTTESTPREASPVTSHFHIKHLPPRTPASSPEAIPPSNTIAPPLQNVAPVVPTESGDSIPFPPAPGSFPEVPSGAPNNVPSSAPDPTCRNRSVKYFDPPSHLPPNSALIPTPCTKDLSASKIPYFDDKSPLPVGSTSSSLPFPSIPTSAVPITENVSKTKVVTPSKSIQLAVLSPPKSTAIPTKEEPATGKPSASIDEKSVEPPQKKAKVDMSSDSESQKESPKEAMLGLGHTLNLLKRSYANNPSDKKEVGGPPEAKITKKEALTESTGQGGTKGADSCIQIKEKTEEGSKKAPQLSRGPLLGVKKDSPTKSEPELSSSIPNVKTPIAAGKTEPTRRLLKLHNFGRESTALKPETSGKLDSSKIPSLDSKSQEKSVEKNKEPEKVVKDADVGEAIEEPVMIVKGEGEGANCESGNVFHDSYTNDGNCSPKPWWECFDSSSSSSNVAPCEDICETIEECVMYFWGDGNGVDCDAGNNGDETEKNSETKQGESGSNTLVVTDNRSNTAPSEIKSQKDKEGSRTGSDLKEVDGLAENDEAKVNGLRTIEAVEKAEKSLNQQEKTESNDDEKHSGVNGKKSKEDNDVSSDKTAVSSKNSKASEGKSKKKKSEKADVDNDVSEKVENEDAEKCEEKSHSDVCKTKKSLRGSAESKEGNRELCAKRGTRNRASLEEVKDVSEDSEDDEAEEGVDEDADASIEEAPAIKRGRGRPKGSTTAVVRGRARRTRSGSHRASDEEEQCDDGDTQEEPAKKRWQRGKGSTARPLPDVPRQRSARIAKIREKEEEDRRNLEALRMKQLAEENRLRELKRKAREERRALREVKKGKREKKEKKDKEKKKKKRKKRGRKKAGSGDPWANSSSTSSSSSEEEDMEEEEEDEALEFKSDHEFSPESDVEDADAQPIRRARTAKKVPTKSEDEEKEEDEELEEDQTQCTKCGHDDHPETILLCDNCDAGWHLSCLRPPLLSVPEGDWICPACEHVTLVKKLKELLERFDECKKKAHTEELRRQRLAYVNVSLDNILPESGKKKKKKRVREDGEEEDEDEDDESGSDSDSEDSDSESDDSSDSSSESTSDSDAPLYTLRARSARTLKEQVEDFDEMINEAIRDEMEAAAGAGNAGRGKDIDNIIQANEEEEIEKAEEVAKDEEDLENGTPTLQNDAEENSEVKREREIDEEDDEEVAPRRKKQKSAENGSENDEDYKASDEQHDSESEEEVKTVKKRSKPYNMFFKKRRRLTDLDAVDDDDASDEDFMNTSEEEDEEDEESAMSSSSLETDCDSDDSDVIGGKRRRSSRYDSLPLRRSTRNRGSRQYDEDSDEERNVKRVKKKKKRRKSSSDEEEESSDSEGSFRRKKKANQRRKRPQARSKGKKGGKKSRSGKKQSKSKTKTKNTEGDEDKPVKPRIKYAKPPKSKDDEDDDIPVQKRVTRGRQVNYCFLMSDETEEEEPQKKWRGKVMKGERVPTESSEYEASDDERKKRRGVSGGLGRGKVMKGEEDDEEEEEKSEKGKKKRGRPKKGDEIIGKPSPPRPSTIKTTPVMGTKSPSPAPLIPVQAPTPKPASPVPAPVIQAKPMSPPTPAQVLQAAVSPSHASLLKSSSITITAARPKPANKPPLVGPMTLQHTSKAHPTLPPKITPKAVPPQAVPTTAPPPSSAPTSSAISYVSASASPVHRALESSVSPSPAASLSGSSAKVIPTSVVTAVNLGNNSPGHQPPVGNWSPHLPGVTITNVSSAPGTPPRPNISSAPGSGTPPRPGLSGPPVTASPPPPYRSSPLPISSVGRGAPPVSSAPSAMPPVGPPNASSPHSAPYPPYRPPPEHYPPHPAKERFPSHPAFPEYAPGRHSPSPHGVPPRHPSHIPSGHSLPHMPAGYGPHGPGSYPPGGVPPPHAGVLRGPPHDLYRPSHSTHPGHGSPSHPGHPHLVMKPGYPGLEPLPYSGSPGPSPGPISMHQGSQDSPAHQSPNEDSKDGTLPSSKAPGEFSSGLMSYFSSQRDDDVE